MWTGRIPRYDFFIAGVVKKPNTHIPHTVNYQSIQGIDTTMVLPKSKHRRRVPKARALLITLVIAAAVLSTIGLASIIGSSASKTTAPTTSHQPPTTSAASKIVKDPFAHPDAQERISHFKETAKSFDPTSDKIGSSTSEHRYLNYS